MTLNLIETVKITIFNPKHTKTHQKHKNTFSNFEDAQQIKTPQIAIIPNFKYQNGKLTCCHLSIFKLYKLIFCLVFIFIKLIVLIQNI